MLLKFKFDERWVIYYKKRTFAQKIGEMALKAVLFDMDGVIVDTEPLHRKAYFAMFEEFGVDISEELYATFAGASTAKICNKVIEMFQLNVPVQALLDSKRKHFKELFYSDTEFDLLPGVRNLIEHYYESGIKLVLASSATRVTIDMVFDKFGLNPYFMAKISGADLNESKPNPEIFVKAAELASEPAENCMVIEDSTNGIQAAYDAHIFCAAYKSENTHGQNYEKANVVVDQYEDLYLNKIQTYFV